MFSPSPLPLPLPFGNPREVKEREEKISLLQVVPFHVTRYPVRGETGSVFLDFLVFFVFCFWYGMIFRLPILREEEIMSMIR